jgi:xanthine/CO dehydrogenase XdhC/CoxF family maturation factor
LAGPEVRIESLSLRVVPFLVRAGHIHVALTGKPLVITSGNDGNHVPGSAHYKNSAVDLRSHEIIDGLQMTFAMVLIALGQIFQVAVFDERPTRSPHWHCEDADLTGA